MQSNEKSGEVQTVWRYRGVEVEFSDAIITPFSDRAVKDISDAMYFYYDIIVRVAKDDGGYTEVFKEMVHDFHNVQYIQQAVQELVARRGDIVLEDYEKEGYSRELRYNYRILEGIIDPSIKIERYDCNIRQEHYDGEIRKEKSTYYTVTITKPFRGGGDSSQREGVVLERVGKKHLLRLANVAEEFCKRAVETYNAENRGMRDEE